MSNEIMPNVILTGGPANVLPDSERIRFIPPTEDNVLKLHRGNRYDQFRRGHPAGTHGAPAPHDEIRP